MKLITKTYLLSIAWMLPLVVVGSIFGFFVIKYILYEEADEFLTYEMNRIVTYHSTYNDLPDFHKVASIIEGVSHPVPVFKDTLLLEPADNEMVPYRELHFSINHKGTDFTLVLRHLLPGEDDVLQGTVIIIVGLMLLFAATLVVVLKTISTKVWTPFYVALKTLTQYKIVQQVPTFPSTDIQEFELLNTTIDELLKKIAGDYQRTKEFNENASHELQTHLAIIRANAEQLLNQQSNAEGQTDKLSAILNATLKLSQAQKSLLLLSKIGNQEYCNPVNVDFDIVLSQALSLFDEVIALRAISLSVRLLPCRQVIDAGLADILVNNLIKNAVKHNVANGFINVELTEKHLVIANSGQPYSGDPAQLMARFAKGKDGNLGIGLAIVKQICDLHGYKIVYSISEKSIHQIQIIFG